MTLNLTKKKQDQKHADANCAAGVTDERRRGGKGPDRVRKDVEYRDAPHLKRKPSIEKS